MWQPDLWSSGGGGRGLRPWPSAPAWCPPWRRRGQRSRSRPRSHCLRPNMENFLHRNYRAERENIYKKAINETMSLMQEHFLVVILNRSHLLPVRFSRTNSTNSLICTNLSYRKSLVRFDCLRYQETSSAPFVGKFHSQKCSQRVKRDFYTAEFQVLQLGIIRHKENNNQ